MSKVVSYPPKGAGQYEYRLYRSQVRVPNAGYRLKKADVIYNLAGETASTIGDIEEGQIIADRTYLAEDPSEGYRTYDPLNEEPTLAKDMAPKRELYIAITYEPWGHGKPFSLYSNEKGQALLVERPASELAEGEAIKKYVQGKGFKYKGCLNVELTSVQIREAMQLKTITELINHRRDYSWLIDNLAYNFIANSRANEDSILVWLPSEFCRAVQEDKKKSKRRGEFGLIDSEEEAWREIEEERERPADFLQQIFDFIAQGKGHLIGTEILNKEVYARPWAALELMSLCPRISIGEKRFPELAERLREIEELGCQEEADTYLTLADVLIKWFIYSKLRKLEPRLTIVEFAEGEPILPIDYKNGYYIVHTQLGAMYLQLWLFINGVKTINLCKACVEPNLVPTPLGQKARANEYCELHDIGYRKAIQKQKERGKEYSRKRRK